MGSTALLFLAVILPMSRTRYIRITLIRALMFAWGSAAVKLILWISTAAIHVA